MTVTDYQANIGWASNGGKSPSKIIREAMEDCKSYDCAAQKLKNEYVTAHVYFILANSTHAEIITRDYTGPVDSTHLTADKWYILQTNSDHFKGECLERCLAGRSLLDKLGQANLGR